MTIKISTTADTGKPPLPLLEWEKFLDSLMALHDMVQERDWARAEVLAEYLRNWVHQRRLDAEASPAGVNSGGGH